MPLISVTAKVLVNPDAIDVVQLDTPTAGTARVWIGGASFDVPMSVLAKLRAEFGPAAPAPHEIPLPQRLENPVM